MINSSYFIYFINFIFFIFLFVFIIVFVKVLKFYIPNMIINVNINVIYISLIYNKK